MRTLTPPLLAVAGALTAPLTASAQDCDAFDAYSTLFDSTSQDGWRIREEAVLTADEGIDPDGDGWLRLTPSSTNTRGAAHSTTSIPTDEGAVFDFDIAAWGGDGADGVSFFLYNASVSNNQFRLGGDGGSLGYAPKGSTQGLRGGYIGVGFDEWGNYANPTEGRVGGPGFRPNWVSIRGPASTGSSGLDPYEYLVGGPTGFRLDCPSPDCTSRPSEGEQGRYRARVVLAPSGGEFRVSAYVQAAPGVPYTEVIAPYTVPVAPPSSVKIGYSGSTGGNTNFHEVRDLLVGKPVDLSLAISQDVDGEALPGDVVTTTLTITNPADALDVCAATLFDQVPDILQGVTWTCTASDGASCDVASGVGNDIAAGISVPAGATITIVIVGTVAPWAEGGHEHTAEVVPGAGLIDAYPPDNHATAVIDVPPDPDGDGLTNAEEYEIGTNPLNPDTDGGGIPDGAEVADGTNPNDVGDDRIPTVDPQLSLDGLPLITGTYNQHALGTLDDDLQVTVNGVTYTLADAALTVDGAGRWWLDLADAVVPLETGFYDVVVVQFANTNPVVSAADVTVDELEVSLGPDPTQVTVNPSTSASGQPTVTGTYDPDQLGSDGDALQVTVDGVTWTLDDDELSVDGQGQWTLDLSQGDDVVLDGTHDVVVVQTNDYDQSVTDATTDELVVDVLPNPLLVTVVSQTTTSDQPTVTGTYDPNQLGDADDALQVTVNGVTYTLDDDELSVDGQGQWALDLAQGSDVVPDGTYDVAVQQRDPQGNLATDSTVDELTIDNTPPPPPTVDAQRTGTTQPRITGGYDPTDIAEHGLTVEVDGVTYVLGVDLALSADGSGGWALDLAATGQHLQEGHHEVVVTQTDPVGHTSTDLTTLEVEVDLTAPATPTVDEVDSDDGRPVITGTYDPEDTAVLEVTVDDVTYVSGEDEELVLNEDGTWELDLTDAPDPLPDGTYDVEVVAYDDVGNEAWDESEDELVVLPYDNTDGDGNPPDVDDPDVDDPDVDDPDVDDPDVDDGTDSDGDGLSDWQEIHDYGTDPNNPDTDGDGLSDWEEIVIYGSDPLNPDSSGDGLTDGQMVELGLDPTRPLAGQGGHSCAVAGGGAPSPLTMLLLLPLVLLRRGRVALLAAVVSPGLGIAQDDAPRVDVQRFQPNPQGATFTRVRDAEQASAGSFGATLSANYGYRTFQIVDAETRERVVGIVDHLTGFDLGLEVAPTDWLSIGVSMPFLQISQLPDDGAQLAQMLGGSARTVGIGDLSIAVGLAPLRQSAGAPLSISVVPRVLLPTGSRGQLLGTGTLRFGADVAAGRRWKHFRFSAMVGYQHQLQSAAFLSVYPDDELRYGLGVGFPLDEGDWEIQLDFVGAAVVLPAGRKAVGDLYDPSVHVPMETGVALQWNPSAHPLWFKVGAGPGVTRAYGTPIFRAFVQGGFVVGRRSAAPAPEDTLDLDRDGDGIPNHRDACPDEAEDFDGFEDDDGCPDLDNDGDGIPDALDACPDEPETFNGFEDDDGCPDDGAAYISWDTNEIVLVENVNFEFDSDRLTARSEDILMGIALVLHAYPSITRVEVQGHTDIRGRPDYNLDLSQRRVDAVVRWLVLHGIAEERLVARGYGAARPLVPDAVSEGEHGLNRRVQFVILERVDEAEDEGGEVE